MNVSNKYNDKTFTINIQPGSKWGEINVRITRRRISGKGEDYDVGNNDDDSKNKKKLKNKNVSKLINK